MELPPAVRDALWRCAEVPRIEWREGDPVRCAHRYADPADREVVALVSALLAFGSAKAFLPKIEALLRVLGSSPSEYVRSFRASRDRSFFDGFRSRIYRGDDLRTLFVRLRDALRRFGTLETAFVRPGAPDPGGHRARLERFAGLFIAERKATPGYRHLVADPRRGGASKRWNLFLRWVSRAPDGIDLGLWRGVSPSDLVIPLDVHVARISGLIGLRTRRTLDWRCAEEITAALRTLDPDDPLRFDFALSHLGISRGCRGHRVDEVCSSCPMRTICSSMGSTKAVSGRHCR